MNLSRVIVDERTQRDIAVQQALAQARSEIHDKIDAVNNVNDDKVSTSCIYLTELVFFMKY